MAKKVDINDLAATIAGYLDEFKQTTDENILEACKETRDSVLPELKANSPKNTGKYAKAWYSTIEKFGSRTEIILRNRQYRLVHLLEFGHAKRNGGRTKPQPHVEPAQTHADDLFLKLLKRRIEAGE